MTAPSDKKTGRAWFFEHFDDGDRSVYIKTDWLAVALILLAAFMLGRCSV